MDFAKHKLRCECCAY